MGDPMKKIMTYGLTEEQNSYVEACTPDGYTIFKAESPTDLIAIQSSVTIVKADALDRDSAEMVYSFYNEVDGCTSEKILWINANQIACDLPKNFIGYATVEEMNRTLKTVLLSQIRIAQKVTDYSRRLRDLVQVLALIRKHPGLSSKAIAEKLEMNPRTVQRNIAVLKAAGEWIEYNEQKKGWQLFHNVSILFGDCWEIDK